MSQPFGFGNVCQPQSDSVPSGVVFSNASGNVCKPVASTVKQNSPLPTDNGFAASKCVSTTSCRVTSACRSIGAAANEKLKQRTTAAIEHARANSGARKCAPAFWSAVGEG